MTTQEKIQAVQEAVSKGIQRQSKLDEEALMVPGLMSLNIRHILNNLGSISNIVCDHGSHVGGSFCSMVHRNDNIKQAISIDSWLSDKTEGHEHYEHFLANAKWHTPENTALQVVRSDSFSVDLNLFPPEGIDFYYYDAAHDETSQRKGLTYYLPVLADTFIFCVDDYMLPEVKKGTQDGIKESGCEVLYENELITDHEYDNESFWRGWYIALLKKK
jgi:hypothetical protein